MMKNIFLLLLLVIASCYFETPKYQIGDRVNYNVPIEHYHECRNSATIVAIIYTVDGTPTYSIQPDPKIFRYRHSICPDRFHLHEYAIRPYSRVIKEDVYDEWLPFF